jgi:hypothetical protein
LLLGADRSTLLLRISREHPLPISSVETISLAFEHTRRQLVEPFRLWQWTRLAFVGLLAGEMSSGGFHFPSSFSPPRQPSSRYLLALNFPKIDPAVWAALITILVVSGLIFMGVMTYISSVMRFILFDSVLAKECHIRDGWNRRQDPGGKYFLWQLAFTLAMLAGLITFVGIPAGIAFLLGWFKAPSDHLPGLILGGIVVFLLAFLFFVAATVVHVVTKDFVVPQMALEGIGPIEGWRRLWPMIQTEKGGYAAYVGMKIVLAIGAGIVIGLATVILVFVLAIPVVSLGVIAAITGNTAGLTWNVFTITAAIVAGCIVFAVFAYLVSLISVPVIVFFPAYSIYFFAPRYRPLSLRLYPPPPGWMPGGPPQQPPPLTPTPEPAG